MCTDTKTDKKILYGIGIGTGDPGLITVKGLELLRSANTVFVPAGKKTDDSLAGKILESAGIEKSRQVKLVFPMSKDRLELEAEWIKTAETVAASLKQDSIAAFVTLGDPSVYSTWIYLRRALQTTYSEVSCRVVPGIQTMNVAAGLLDVPLVEGKERLALVPAPDTMEELDPLFPLFDTVVFYKVGKRLEQLCRFITEKGCADRAYFVQRAGLEGEVTAAGLTAIPEEATGYLSVMIVKTGRGAVEAVQ
jgi:precorrin-2/cobalt-factor-2 C20-methyltransferase